MRFATALNTPSTAFRAWFHSCQVPERHIRRRFRLRKDSVPLKSPCLVKARLLGRSSGCLRPLTRRKRRYGNAESCRFFGHFLIKCSKYDHKMGRKCHFRVRFCRWHDCCVWRSVIFHGRRVATCMKKRKSNDNMKRPSLDICEDSRGFADWNTKENFGQTTRRSNQ